MCKVLETMDSSNELTQLSRPEVVKQLWQYIQVHELQDPANRRTIVCDDKLKAIFGRDQVTMFSMNKYLTKHLVAPAKFESEYHSDWTKVPLQFTPEEELAYDASKKRQRVEKQETKKKPKAKASGRGLQRPMVLSPALAQLVGAEVMARCEVVKELWVYIKAHELQNPENKREIQCDAPLESLFGETHVTIFSMHKFLNPHFIKPALIENE